MKTNMGNYDRSIRIILAASVVVLYVSNLISGALATGLLTIAAVFVITSFIGVCPLYLPFGISTNRRHKVSRKDNVLK